MLLIPHYRYGISYYRTRSRSIFNAHISQSISQHTQYSMCQWQ